MATNTTLITDYLGIGLAAARPATLNLPSGALGIYYATDTGILSMWNGSTWIPGPGSLAGASDVTITSPADGDRLHYVAATGKWVNGREPYIVGSFVPGTMTASQIIAFHSFAEKVVFPANFGTANSGGVSKSDALANATGSTVLTIYQCPAASDPTSGGSWSSVGTVTFAASGHTGTFASSGGTAVTFQQGDRMKILGPGTADATLANVDITLAGDR